MLEESSCSLALFCGQHTGVIRAAAGWVAEDGRVLANTGMQPGSDVDRIWRRGRKDVWRSDDTGIGDEDLGASAGVAWKRRSGLSPRTRRFEDKIGGSGQSTDRGFFISSRSNSPGGPTCCTRHFTR